MRLLPLVVLATALSLHARSPLQAQACPVGKESEATWVRHVSPEFGIEISGPSLFEQKNWSSRSDTTSAVFSLWKDAATTVDLYGPTHWGADAVRNAKGTRCVMKTAAGRLPLTVWISHGVQYNGRDTTYYNAGGEITLRGRAPMLVKLTAHDSLTLLVNLQMLQTMKLVSPLR